MDTYNKKKEPPERMINREQGSTNFKQCGWCEYAMGSHRHNYCISGSCQLQRSYDDDIKWDTLCLFVSTSQADIQALIGYKEYRIKGAEDSIQQYKKYIEILSKMKEEAPVRPPLPNDRKFGHFNIDDEVMVASAEKDAEDNALRWYSGKVKDGYRHQDGCVSFCLNGIGPQEANDTEFPFKGGYWGTGICVPTIILKSEYDFFVDNPSEFEIWKEKVESEVYNGKSIELPPLS